jgi:hypothetical protein
MKELFIKQINPGKKVSLKEAAHILETQTVTNPIDTLNWAGYPVQTKTEFQDWAHRNRNLAEILRC